MSLRDQVAEVIAAADGRYEHADADTIADAVMGVVEARIAGLEAAAERDYSGDPWDHGYLRALKDMRGEQ
ncbi:hypothetical protein [Nocardiopsis synnemataformans]|uniref:hypothetical protein n=1 Tax=Nocardiopsis synnemataformans TaxID=61305 RepID=UPI003EBF758A